LLEIAERVKAKGADFCILNLGDTGTATGHLMFTVIGALACFERELMLERQREGIAQSESRGKIKGTETHQHVHGLLRSTRSTHSNLENLAFCAGLAAGLLLRD
jgi:DNA invertase Pin-like site-specific DNA recombinase